MAENKNKACCGLLHCFQKSTKSKINPAEAQEEQRATDSKMAAHMMTQRKFSSPDSPSESTSSPGIYYRRISDVTLPNGQCLSACFPAKVDNVRRILGECTFCHKDITLDVTTCWNCSGKYCFDHKYPNQHHCPNTMTHERYKAMKKEHDDRMAARSMQDPATG